MRQRSKSGLRERSKLSMYGLTPEDYYSLLDKQGGACAICRGQCKTGKKLAVDHDHETGKVRGLLCTRCNVALGMFQDDMDRMAKAIAYLKGGSDA